MTIKEMHIGIDLIIQRLNSNIDVVIEHEEKDYFINTVTINLLRIIALQEKNSLSQFISKDDISKYYIALQKYIHRQELNIKDFSYYCIADLPKSNKFGTINSGLLINGVKYKVKTKGSTDLSKFGYDGISDEFVCNTDVYFNTGVTQLETGEYKILHYGADSDFSQVVIHNDIFIVTDTYQPLLSLDSNTPLKPLKLQPTWDGITELEIITDNGFFLPISSISYVEDGNKLTDEDLIKDNYYVVYEAYSIKPDVSSVDVNNITAANKGYVFYTNNNDGIVYNNAELYKLKSVENKLVLDNKELGFINNSFGVSKTSPISVIENDKLKVYYGNNFKVYKVELKYVIKPRPVDYNNNIDSDFPESLQPLLVELVSKYILFILNRPESKNIDYVIKDKNIGV